MHLFWSIGVVGTACRKGDPSNWGRPAWAEIAPPNIVETMVHAGVGQVVVLLKLGNASGGKGPDFWCAFEGADDW
jgi:hypothetical protein